MIDGTGGAGQHTTAGRGAANGFRGHAPSEPGYLARETSIGNPRALAVRQCRMIHTVGSNERERMSGGHRLSVNDGSRGERSASPGNLKYSGGSGSNSAMRNSPPSHDADNSPTSIPLCAWFSKQAIQAVTAIAGRQERD